MRPAALLLRLFATIFFLIDDATGQCTGQGRGNCNLALEGHSGQFSLSATPINIH